ncbi:MAG: class I SAM-dependent methyltransferase [Planctomycetes bacterium]|nr:class I SAM-dependent methyltransferase [Planctomycetota bacterium]MCB9891517.1 class I SAM-dependent methyltransferase [Planctomycetota bacterium]
MAGTYGTVNLLSSFGFTKRWRRQCLDELRWTDECVLLDLMAGMGEASVLASSRRRPRRSVTVDISPVMCRKARRHEHLDVLRADALNLPLPNASVDAVVSTFGLKTFDAEQWTRLASEVQRVLKPGGTFAFLEIAVPKAAFLRLPLLLYIELLIPWIGRFCLGNPDNYRYLGRYTRWYGDGRSAREAFEGNGLAVDAKRWFFGCATGFAGVKARGVNGGA